MSQGILGDTFWQAGRYPRETANINTLCVHYHKLLLFLWYNSVGTEFVSHYCLSCWSWTVLLLFGNYCLKLESL